MTAGLDDGVARTCETYLRLADQHAPGLVEGLYLQGSIALGDYRPGVSDIDFVAVTGQPPDPAAVHDIRLIHAELRRRAGKPFFDGLYVGWGDLRQDPARVAPGPAVHEWRVDPASRFERHLVTWHVLAQGGVAVRGPAVTDLGVHTTCDQRWHRVVREALRIRAGGPPLYRNPWRRRADAVGFLTDLLNGSP
ncbi:nucleotidyltransferase domain-containing protein [Actinomycetes bacterium KLBMP 9797]